MSPSCPLFDHESENNMTLPTHRRPFFLAAGLGLVLALLAFRPALQAPLSQSPVTDDPAVVVEMTNRVTFAPDSVRIAVGETVRWDNTSLIAHTVTADPDEATLDGSVRLPESADPFNSGMMDAGESFSHTFTTPGVYKYFCIPHEGAQMNGVVVVTPSGN